MSAVNLKILQEYESVRKGGKVYGNVIAAGTAASTGTVTVDGHTICLKLRAATNAVVVLNGKSVNLPSQTQYQDFYGDYSTWSITSGTVDWVAFG